MEDNNPLIESFNTRSSSQLSELCGRVSVAIGRWRNRIIICCGVLLMGVCVAVVISTVFGGGEGGEGGILYTIILCLQMSPAPPPGPCSVVIATLCYQTTMM